MRWRGDTGDNRMPGDDRMACLTNDHLGLCEFHFGKLSQVYRDIKEASYFRLWKFNLKCEGGVVLTQQED